MNGVELIWQFIACLLVLSMQAGFLLLEAGRVSSKNSVNVAQKNVTDFVISTFCFITIGSFIMFGLSAPLSLAQFVCRVIPRAPLRASNRGMMSRLRLQLLQAPTHESLRTAVTMRV